MQQLRIGKTVKMRNQSKEVAYLGCLLVAAWARSLSLLYDPRAIREVLIRFPVLFVGHDVSLLKQESIKSLETTNTSSLMQSFPLAVLQLRQLFGSAVPAFPPKVLPDNDQIDGRGEMVLAGAVPSEW